MTDTLHPSLRKPFTLPEALLPDGRKLLDVRVQILARLENASTPGADLYEAVLTHKDVNGKPTPGLPRVICKLVPAEPVADHIPPHLGLREEYAYQLIRAHHGQLPVPLAHLVGYIKTDQEYLFIIERYGVNAIRRIQSLRPEERAAGVQHFFAAGYLALRHLNQRVNISMRDAHPKNFVFRQPMKGEPGFEFVAVDFGHANVGPVHTGEVGLEAMAIIQHPDVLAPGGRHRGLEDDLFSLAVSSHILLSKDQATPWVDRSGRRIHFDKLEECSKIRYRMSDAANLLEPQWEVTGGGAHADFLKILEELLQPQRTREERRRYVAEELPALISALEPWTAESIAEMERSSSPDGRDGEPGAATAPLPPTAATVPGPSPASGRQEVRAPHGIPYLAELEDFRPPPPAPAPSRYVVAKQQRVARGQSIRTALLHAVPFLVLAVLLAVIKLVPGLGLDALRSAQILPRGWELPSNILLALAFVVGSVGLLMSRPSGGTSLGSALGRGTIAGLGSGLALVAAPTAAVWGAESLLYVLPGTTWRFEDWSFWPQWFLVIGFLGAVVLGLGSFFLGKGGLLAAGAALLIAGLTSAMISSAAPLSFQAQHVLQVDCGAKRFEFTHMTQSLCIPDSPEWEQMDAYADDPFVLRMQLPKPGAPLGSGPNRVAVGLKSEQFPCLSLFVLWDRPSPADDFEMTLPQATTDPNSPMAVISGKDSDGRVTRLRLGGGSYNVYKGITNTGGSASGTVIYSALSTGDWFVNPEDFLRTGHQGIKAFQVQRDCPTGDQANINHAVEKLISTVKLNERYRLDVSEIQFNSAALAAKNLDASRIEIPVPAGTSAAFFGEQRHGLFAMQGVIAVGGVILTNNNNFDKTSYATVSIADAPPENFASTTTSNIDSDWTMGDVTSSEQEISQSHYQKQTVNGLEYYVTVSLSIRDQGAYDDGAKQRFKEVLSGIQVENSSIRTEQSLINPLKEGDS